MTAILVVEDTKAVALLLLQALEEAGYRADHAASLAAAKARLHAASNPYAVALVDMQLPDGCGLDLVTGPAADYLGDTIAISADSTGAVAALSAGCTAFLEKPVSPQHVVERLSTMCPVTAPCSAADSVTARTTPAITAEHAVLEASYRHYLQALRQQLRAPQDLATLRSDLHQLKGSAMLYGYSGLSRLAAILSRRLRRGGRAVRADIQADLRTGIARCLTV